MAKLLSFASWNVEHFSNKNTRVERCVEFIRDDADDPDLFAVFEVLGKDVFAAFTELMPTHNFYITEGLQSQETLVGVRKEFTAFVTQRQGFKSKIPTLRPGVLVTVLTNGLTLPFLFLHVKSSPNPHGWGLRTDMLEHALNLKKALDAQDDNGNAPFVVLGDLNTMGLVVRDGDNDITGAQEIDRLVKRFRRRDMDLISKSHDQTWWGGTDTYEPSNLDHVLATNTLDIRNAAGNAGIDVLGWPQLPNAQDKINWIDRFSDHALIRGEVWG